MVDDQLTDGGAPYERVSVAELERERLVTYVMWGEVDAPRWYWPIYSLVVAGWIAAYAFGPLWGTVGAVLMVATMGGLVSSVTSRTGVTTPRFRSMPSVLRRTFLPILGVGVVGLGSVVAVFFASNRPLLLVLGPVVGVALGLAGWINARWYRRESRRLAAEHGIVV